MKSVLSIVIPESAEHLSGIQYSGWQTKLDMTEQSQLGNCDPLKFLIVD